jgi:PPOX class probable F420-dependent enzyme
LEPFDQRGGFVDRDEALERLRSARVGRIATVTPDGRPHVVPFVFAVVERDPSVLAYWAVDRKPKRAERLQRLRNLERNPAAEFVVDGYDEDWRALWWVRASGTGRVVDDASRERAAALDALASKYPRYASEPPPGPVVAIDIDRISGWRAEPEWRLGDRS